MRWPSPNKSLNRLTLLVVVATAISLLAVACGGGKETDPEKLIPAGSNLVAQVNVSGILGSEGVGVILEALPLGAALGDSPGASPTEDGGESILDTLLDEALSETGIDARKISRMSVFGEVGRINDFVGVIAKGEFNELELLASMREASGNSFEGTDYKGSLVYVPDDDEDSFALTILEEENLVVGTLEAVRAVIDVQKGDRKPESGRVMDAFNDLGPGLFRIEVDLGSSNLLDQLPDLGSIPFLRDAPLPDGLNGLPAIAGALQDLNLLGLVLTQNGQLMILQTNLDFASEESASSVSDLLDGVLKLATAFVSDEETTKLLEGLQISRNDKRLSIRLETPAADIGDLLAKLLSPSSVESSGRTAAPPPIPVPVELGNKVALMPTRFHVDLSQSVEYSTRPPTSGDHWERWGECGLYQDGLPDELTTHNLEHGNIVVSYNLSDPGLIDELRVIMERFGREWGVARFYDQIPPGTVALAAWGRLDIMQGLDPIRISQFFELYAGNLGPEQIPC